MRDVCTPARVWNSSSLSAGDERGSKAEEDSSRSRKCHFSVIVYDSSLHLWLNNEGWQLERAMGVGIKGLRFPLAESGLSECAPSKLDPDVEVCAAIGCCCCCRCCHTTGSFCQPASHSASQQLASQPISQPPCLQTWQETLPVRAWDRGPPPPNKRIPARGPRRGAKGCKVSFLCMLWFI